MNDREHIVNELKKQVRVTVEWDGRVQDDLAAAYDVALQNDFLWSFEEFLDAAESISRNCQLGIELDLKIGELNRVIDDAAKKIEMHAQTIKQPVTKISERYFKYAARKIVMENKAKCVFVTPDLWLPG